MHGINWGDVPTWLAVVVASVGGGVALRQLRNQQDDMRRQTVQLERQQAEQIGFSWRPTECLLGIHKGPEYVGVVENGSTRPIRDVSCWIRPDPDEFRKKLDRMKSDEKLDGMKAGTITAIASGEGPFVCGELVTDGTPPSTDRFNPISQPIPLIRAGKKYEFRFHTSVKRYGDALIWVSFTDDVGLLWEIDTDLRLRKVENLLVLDKRALRKALGKSGLRHLWRGGR